MIQKMLKYIQRKRDEMKVKLTADSSLALIVISFSSVVTDVKGFKY